ncbi:FAD-binding protein [Arthrobacter sp. AZCC_0090]|uniref:FAD-binding protein n=1 Tax=Arthrobacter sp. AZCC_0090 TaxID=2735881 RepID=UPI0016139EF8
MLKGDRQPVPGLYAAGNVMGSPTGSANGPRRGTLGHAFVFGYPAGEHAATLVAMSALGTPAAV